MRHCDCRNGYIDGQDKKTNLRNIFDDSIIARILDYYGEVKKDNRMYDLETTTLNIAGA